MKLDVINTKRPTKWNVISNGFAIADFFGIKKSKLVPEKIIDEACKRAKSDNHQMTDVVMDGFERLIWSINEESGMDAFGFYIAQNEMIERVYNRIRLNDDIAKTPDSKLPKEQLFVIGFPRTGSTHLHNLLSLEEGTRTPRFWELCFPVPYPRKESYETDERIGKLDRMLKQLDQLAPLARRIHPMEADSPEECHYLMNVDFVGAGLSLFYNVPSYWKWLKTLNVEKLDVLYENYEKYIKYICTELGNGIRLRMGSYSLKSN